MLFYQILKNIEIVYYPKKKTSLRFFKKTYTEKEIVEGCIANKRFFQEKLYQQHFSVMMAMCMRHTNDRNEAMEMVNNGFLRVFKKLDTFGFKGSLQGWIRKLVYHSMADYFRKNNKKGHFLIFEEFDKPINEKANSNLFFDDLLTIVKQLPEATQRVFMLYAIEGYKHTEIAKQLNISAGTSKWHLSEARKRLRILLEQNTSKQYAK